jgi:hypothetical protein
MCTFLQGADNWPLHVLGFIGMRVGQTVRLDEAIDAKVVVVRRVLRPEITPVREDLNRCQGVKR